jgi:hypothetical protein
VTRRRAGGWRSTATTLLLGLGALGACSDGGSPVIPGGAGAGGAGTGAGGAIDVAGVTASASSGSAAEGAGGQGGASPAPPLALAVEWPVFAVSFERAALAVRLSVAGPAGSTLQLLHQETLLAEHVTALEREVVSIDLPFARGSRAIDARLQARGGEASEATFAVHGGRPVAATIDRMLAIRDGALRDWGGGDPTPRSWPMLGQVTSVHARGASALTIDAQGDVALLDLDAGTATTLASGQDVVAAALGGAHLLLLRADGTLLAGGANDLGQLGVGDTAAHEGLVEVTSIADVVAIAAAEAASYAVAADGTVLAWGENDDGQLGLGGEDEVAHASPAIVPNLSGVVGVAAGRDHVLVLRASGEVLAWGAGSSGQLGNGASGILAGEAQPVATQTTEAMIDISAASNSSFAIGAGGTLWAWGQNSLAQLGVGDTSPRVEPAPNAMALASACAAGPTGGIALDDAARVFVWGSNGSAQLGLPPPPDGPERSATPVEVVLP